LRKKSTTLQTRRICAWVSARFTEN